LQTISDALYKQDDDADPADAISSLLATFNKILNNLNSQKFKKQYLP